MNIQQISSATFLQLGVWVAVVMRVAAIGRLELVYFYVEKNHKNNSSQHICFIFVLFLAATT